MRVIYNCREYGSLPYSAIVVHGGPGAPGCCAGICRGLANDFGILEYLQTKNSINELLEELRELILNYKLDKIILIGHSWGAWLSFIFAAKYPRYVSKLILIGCGPFDVSYYPQLVEARSVKTMPEEQKEDMITANLYTDDKEYDSDHYCLLPNIKKDMISFNEEQFKSLMNEIVSMRASGELLDFSKYIECPVVAIHGKNDPHPWKGVKIPLENRLKDFKLFLINKCGHDPWKEYYAKDEFFAILKKEIDILTHIGTQTLETDRLLLRKYEITDADDMYRNWVTDPAASRFWGWKPHENIAQTKSLLQGWINDYTKIDNYHWVIVIKELSEAVGYIYLSEINNEEKSASIHYLVSRRFWNQGITTEACRAILGFSFNRVGITRIHSHHHIDNPASGKVMQKSGMHYLETKYKEIPGSPQISGDYSYYEITLEDWI